MTKFTTEHENILWHIESSIIHLHRFQPLSDADVMKALEVLFITFKQTSQGKEPEVPRLSDRMGQWLVKFSKFVSGEWGRKPFHLLFGHFLTVPASILRRRSLPA
jgi:hypothetical protein